MVYETHFPASKHNNSSSVRVVPGGPSVACSTAAAVAWDKSFKTFSDCSGRSVKGVHEDGYDESVRQIYI